MITGSRSTVHPLHHLTTVLDQPYNITTNTSGYNMASVPLKEMLSIAVKKINTQESCGPAITHSHFLNYLMDQQKQVYIYFS